MGASYKIFGMAVKPHYLAIATLLGTFGGAALLTGGKSDDKAKEGTAVFAASSDNSNDGIDVENLLDQFLKESEGDKK